MHGDGADRRAATAVFILFILIDLFRYVVHVVGTALIVALFGLLSVSDSIALWMERQMGMLHTSDASVNTTRSAAGAWRCRKRPLKSKAPCRTQFSRFGARR